MGLSEISKQEIFKSFAPREERKIDLEDFRIRISELGTVEEERTRKMLIEEHPDIFTNLPFDHSDSWTEDLRKPIF